MQTSSTMHLVVSFFTLSAGDRLKCENTESLLHNLEQAAAYYASAIQLSSRNARLHFLLGLVLEEQHSATEMYGLQKKVVFGKKIYFLISFSFLLQLGNLHKKHYFKLNG